MGEKKLEDGYKEYVSKVPGGVAEVIEYLSKDEVSTEDADKKFGWARGTTRGLLKRYPSMREDVRGSRVIAMKAAGLSKGNCYGVYAEAMGAMKEGEVEDHEVRIKAADRVLHLFGEKPVSGEVGKGVVVNVGVLVATAEEEKEIREIRGGMNGNKE